MTADKLSQTIVRNEYVHPDVVIYDEVDHILHLGDRLVSMVQAKQKAEDSLPVAKNKLAKLERDKADGREIKKVSREVQHFENTITKFREKKKKNTERKKIL